MELEKATIGRYDPATGKTRDAIEVLLNPTNYHLTRSNRFKSTFVPGSAAPFVQFSSGNARTLSMQLFFDSYEAGEDVRTYTDWILDLLALDEGQNDPSICLFSWGNVFFLGYLERANQSFTLFLSDGTPVRATMDVTLKEYFDGKKQAARLQSADFAKRYVVRSGDTLSRIAGDKYGNPALWRPIAEENGLDDPLAVHPGQVLKIPTIM